jgi:hypothetical protein
MKKILANFRLDQSDRDRLTRLAADTGRSRSNIFRRLLDLADTPTGRQFLGNSGAEVIKHAN